MTTTTNPRTAESAETDIADSTPEQVADACALAAEGARELAGSPRSWRAGMLDAVADALEEDRDELVQTADAETGLGATRLNGELSRSAFQFRLFGEAVRDGGYLEAAIDHAGQTPLGPGPDVRRMLVAVGPVAVFGASNFPFAFSVAGGDTASALAAGCPVVLKAHEAHPLTSKASFEALRRAVAGCEAPAGTVGIVYGRESGARLVSDPRIKAASFTGSLAGGKALQEIIDRRDDPIPFYGELSSINPLVITPGAAAERTGEIAEGLFGSVTGSGGQLCTKPGLAFVPAGEAGDRLVAELSDLIATSRGHVLLNDRIRQSYGEIRQRLEEAGAEVVSRGSTPDDPGFWATATLLTVDAADMVPELAEEAFGPLLVVVRYADRDGLVRAFDRVPYSLTATIHAQESETDDIRRLTQELIPQAGRIIYNGYPTGVRVSWAQHHGGPWPSTNSQHTSVGVTAIRRFLRPVAWQSAPEWVLPEELRDGYHGVPRRVDGVLEPARGH